MPPEVANYAERLSISDAEYTKKLDIVKIFLAYAKKEGINEIKSVHSFEIQEVQGKKQ